MPTKISGYIADELADLIDEMADHHDVPRSRVLELLLREGVNNRHQRIRMEQMDLKIQKMLVGLGVEQGGKFQEELTELSEEVGNMPLPEGTTGVDLVTPHPYFGGDGWYYGDEDDTDDDDN